jgi:gliding-associated putative ABC transporter substrate-binding component GldG
MDLQCELIPMVVGGTAETPQYEFLHWNYFPLLSPAKEQLLSKNIGYVSGKFVNSIDTIKVAGITKTPLLVSSPNSRIIRTPALISLNENKNVPQDEKFRMNGIPAAILLEGKFTSLFRNRVSKVQSDSLLASGNQFLQESTDNKMIVVADGDLVLNEFARDESGAPLPLPMGWNKYTYTEYQKQSEMGRLFIPVANREFLINCVEYLVNDPAIIETKNKDVVLRLLDSQKVKENKTFWQLINIALPIALVILSAFVYQQARRRKFGS